MGTQSGFRSGEIRVSYMHERMTERTHPRDLFSSCRVQGDGGGGFLEMGVALFSQSPKNLPRNIFQLEN